MAFFEEPDPLRGLPLEVSPGIRRIVARNPGVMTYHGTNTYLISDGTGITVLDPGPDDEVHVKDVLAAAGTVPIKNIVVTHAHKDHYGAAEGLKNATGAPVCGYTISSNAEFRADIQLTDGAVMAGLKSVYTPGHASDHLCFEYRCEQVGTILFTGDHVMSWSSSIVSPPDGNMLHYYRSLELLLRREDVWFLPGHGPKLIDPKTFVKSLLSSRQRREDAIIDELKKHPWTIRALSATLYAKTDPRLIIAAQRNVLAHLLKLKTEGIVIETAIVTDCPDGIESEELMSAVENESSGNAPALGNDEMRCFNFRY